MQIEKIFGELLPIGWQGIASIAGFLVVVVALVPIFKEWFHKKKTVSIVRTQLFKELLILGKGLKDKKEVLQVDPSKPGLILDENGQKVLNNLENMYQQIIVLRKREVNNIDFIIRMLRLWLDYDKIFDSQKIDAVHLTTQYLLEKWKDKSSDLVIVNKLKITLKAIRKQLKNIKRSAGISNRDLKVNKK